MIKSLSTTIFFLGFLISLSALASSKVNTKICRKKHGLFQKPGSLCKAYYKCTNYVPVELLCPPDHHFSTTKLRCDWMDLFPCLEKPKTKECPTADGKFLKPGTGCTYYYDCCNGKPTEKKCPQGHLFDPSKGGCKLKSHYTCIENISTEGPMTTVLTSTSRLTEPTTEEEVSSTILIRESTPGETVHSTTSIMKSTPRKTIHSTTSIMESTPEEIVSSTTTISDSTTDQITHSTVSASESTFEVVHSTTSIRESTLDERVSFSTPEVHFTTSVPDSTPEGTMPSTTSIRKSTPEEIADSTTSVGETTPEEIGKSTTLIYETTFEESTTSTIETDERTTILEVSLSTENERITKEPTIMCPEPFGYYPHPTDKHKFFGCVDNVPTVLTCPNDLIYDDEHKQCVYE